MCKPSLSVDASMRRRALWLLLALSACGSPATPPAEPAQPCTTGTAACADRIEIGAGVFLPYFSSYPLTAENAEVVDAVIVIHGTNRDADTYFETMVAATRGAERLDRTLIVSPHFQLESDGPRADEPYWTDGGWKRGHLSVTGGPTPRVSSYAALDRIAGQLADRSRFPRLTRVMVAGHSAGGQVVHRYAAASPAENALSGVAFRYIVANPSTYLYLTPERPDGDGFGLPDAAACPTYDNWHYGLGANLNTYVMSAPPAQVPSRLATRDVRILIGDRDMGSAQLDQSCGANLQGEHRFDRGQRIVRYMDARHPGHRHLEMIVPGVAHSSRGMFTSAVGHEALFGGP